MAKNPYKDRTDLEKVQSQWHKLSGLHTREEWSAAIVRAATAAEIAANHAIHCEFDRQSQLSAHFVDSTLRWANGLAGKIDRLLLPMTKSSKKKHAKVKELQKLAQAINEKRNAIAHQGEFCNEKEAKEIIAVAEKFISDLVTLYDKGFVLKTRKDARL